MKRVSTFAAACLTSLAAACHSTPAEPAVEVRMDVRVTPAVVSIGDEVVVELTVTNEGNEIAVWSSGCGTDLAFAVLNAAGMDVLAAGPVLCTMELRNPRLEAGAVMTRTFHWRPPRRVAPGSYSVAGRLGFLGPIPSRGTQAVLRVDR